MVFKRIPPAPGLEKLIECYWIIEDSERIPHIQKIIPDGFAEIIFHKGDLYKIKLVDAWRLQSRNLLAGQIDKYFELENTGTSSMIGIKFRPTALTYLFDLDMGTVTNRVVDVEQAIPQIKSVLAHVHQIESAEEVIPFLDNYILSHTNERSFVSLPVSQAVDLIFERNGLIQIHSLCESVGVGERQLEYLFKKNIGLTPKRFAQIIRFNYIFHLVEDHQGWSDIAYEAAYYDQSHFIRNFKNFTGENPTDYAFDEKNMANFFLKKAVN